MDACPRKLFRDEQTFSGLPGQLCFAVHPEYFQIDTIQERFGVPRPALQP
jgi:hypothetical protein